MAEFFNGLKLLLTVMAAWSATRTESFLRLPPAPAWRNWIGQVDTAGFAFI